MSAAPPADVRSRGAYVLVAESAAAAAGIPKRVVMDVRALLAAGEHVIVVASDADRLAPSLADGETGRLETVAFENVGTVPELMALKAAHVLRARTLYEELEMVFHVTGLARGAERAMRDVLATHPVRAIVAHDATFVHAARRARGAARTPVLYVVHALIAERVRADASPHGPIATRHRLAVERTALREADWVVPVSRSTAAVCRAEGAAEARLRVRHNAIDLPSALRPPYDETTRDVDLLYVGRLSTEKGVETLLEAVRLLGAPLRLTVVGDGPLEPAVRETAAALPGRVALLGALPHAEVLALFRRARLAVVPSYSEPFGFVVLEAFTQGTPVVAADTGGIPEIADDASGAVLVPPRDAPALARAIARLAAAPAERAALSHAAYERAQVFAFERAGPETVALYRACADAGRATPPVATGDAPRGGAGAARPEPAR